MADYQVTFTLQSQFIGTTQADNFTIIGKHANGSPSDTTIATNVTKAQLTAGVTYTIADTITGGTITSTGDCTNSVNWLGLNSTAPTPTPTSETLYWYELNRCDQPGTICYSIPIAGGVSNAGKVFWSAGGEYYTMGNYYNYLTDPDPGVGDCSDKLEGTIVTGTCSDYTTVPVPTPTPTPAQFNAEIRECGTSTTYYATIIGSNSLSNTTAFKATSPGGTADGKCWEIVDNTYSGSIIDFTATIVNNGVYLDCSACTPD